MQEKSFGINKKRIEWLDASRGILIILMVVGHSTGLFNKYIYQFHMAAFFFLSGYVANLERKGFFRTLFDKFFTVLLPAIATVLVGLFILWLLHLGHYDVLLSTWEFPGWKQALTSFFTHGDIYVDVLGANWFLITLFGICILNKLIQILAHNSLAAYFIFALILYVVGYGISKSGNSLHIGMFFFDLVFIGNLFYTIGYCIKKTEIFEQVAKLKVIWKILLAVTIICNFLISRYLHIKVDWPSRTFEQPMLEGLSALNGIILVFTASLFVECLLKKAGRILVYIGKSTMGILFFHFAFFKIMYLPFYCIGMINKEDLSRIVPGQMSTSVLERQYWYIIAFGSLVLSLFTWKMLLQNKVLNFLLGQSKQGYVSIWNKLVKTMIVTKLAKAKVIWTNKISKSRLYISRIYKQNRLFYLSLTLILILVAIPLYKQGIMCNDEVKARLWSIKGFSQFYAHYFEEHIAKGRALSTIFVSFTMFLGFLGSNNWSFKIFQILSILSAALLFGIFLKKVFNSTKFAILCGLSIVVFLPITFEHTAPNAFNVLYNIPFCMLLLSLNLFVDYVESERKLYLVSSMILLFINLVSYESFVMFLPLYWGLVFWKIGINSRKQILIKGMYPTVVAVIFLILYIVAGMVFPSDYSGNQVGFSIIGSLKIILQLVMASLPGYYLFTPKYKYLFAYYHNLGLENYVRIILSCVVFGSVIYYLTKTEKKNPEKKGKFWGAIGMGVLCVVLPTCPIAVAKMYQGHVGPNDFMALPTTFFTYFAATFICWFVIWQLIQRFQRKGIFVLVAFGACCYLFPVQAMNDVLAEQQKQDYQRLTTMEALFSTDLMKLFDGWEIKSTDLFITKNALAIHDSYWTEFANAKGRNIQITNVKGTSDEICLYFDGNQFVIRNQNVLCIITTKPQIGYGICQYAEDQFLIASYDTPIEDNGLYEYFYKLSDKKELIKADKGTFELELVGNTLQNCFKQYGYYEDGWVEKSSQFLIRTLEEGRIEIKVYCPMTDFNNREIKIYINGILADIVKLQDPIQVFNIETVPDQIVSIGIETNFVQERTGTDARTLSMVISSMQAY